MSTESAVATKAAGEGTTAAFSLIFELEGAAVDGHAKLFDAAKHVFQKAGITLTDRQVARFCTHGAIPQIIQKMIDELGGGKLGADAAEQILAAYHDSFRDGNLHVHPLFSNFIAETNRRGIRATAISVLPEDIAQGVLAKSGLTDKGVELHVFAEVERHFPRVDCWMKVCRQVAKSPRSCIAVAGCRDSGKSALSCGMRCVIIPDQFTNHQDFSGADAVIESAADQSPAELLDLLT